MKQQKLQDTASAATCNAKKPWVFKKYVIKKYVIKKYVIIPEQ
jgi:hypothetical protein